MFGREQILIPLIHLFLEELPGRPKKLRWREFDEPQKETKIDKQHVSMKCSRCNQYGYNKRSCKENRFIETSNVIFYADLISFKTSSLLSTIL